MTNKEKFLLLVSKEENDTIKRVRERIKNRPMLRESQKIALKVLMKLDEIGWSQKDLATKMEVSPQQISKIVSGKENLTLITQLKLQEILDIPILATYYENKMKTNKVVQVSQILHTSAKVILNVESKKSNSNAEIRTSKVIHLKPLNNIEIEKMSAYG